MENLNEIHWHDSEVESVIEIPAKDELIYNIQYPENWNQNIFEPKAITFFGYHSHSIEEMPFEGNPTILAASVVKVDGEFTTIKLETNAGVRYVTAKGFHIALQSAHLEQYYIMNELLDYLGKWKTLKSQTFAIEGFEVSITEVLGDQVKARYLDIDGNGLLSRATLWESGNLNVEAVNVKTEEHVILKQFDVPELWQLDDKLNWWLSEIVTYDASKP